MSKYFPKIRRVNLVITIVVSLLGFGITFLLFQQYIQKRILVSILVGFVCGNISRYYGRITCMKQYHEVMALLYGELNPLKFIEVATPFLAIKVDTLTDVTTTVHLANAYMAAGKPEVSIQLLTDVSVPEKAMELAGLVHLNLASAYIQSFEFVKANDQIMQVKRILQRPKCKTDFINKAKHTIAYQELSMKVLQDSLQDSALLQQDFEKSHREWHKVNVKWLEANWMKNRGRIEECKEACKYIMEHGMGLYQVGMARELLKNFE